MNRLVEGVIGLPKVAFHWDATAAPNFHHWWAVGPGQGPPCAWPPVFPVRDPLFFISLPMTFFLFIFWCDLWNLSSQARD